MDQFEKLAARVSSVYKKREKVAAVMLAGSVSRGWQDAYSDIELYVLWQEAPSDDERIAVIQELQGDIIQVHPFEEEEWADAYLVDGVKIEVSGFLTETISRWVRDVTVHYDTSFDKQHILASIADGRALIGEAWIADWKRQAAYPEQLACAMVTEHLETTGRWSSRYALLHRRDVLMLQAVKCQVLQQLFSLVFALNHQYVPHPLFKWSGYYTDRLSRAPENLQSRVEHALMHMTEKSIQEVETLMQEVYDLVEEQYPTIDMSVYRNQFVRPVQ